MTNTKPAQEGPEGAGWEVVGQLVREPALQGRDAAAGTVQVRVRAMAMDLLGGSVMAEALTPMTCGATHSAARFSRRTAGAGLWRGWDWPSARVWSRRMRAASGPRARERTPARASPSRSTRQAVLSDGARGQNRGGPAQAGPDARALPDGRPRHPLRRAPGEPGRPARPADRHRVRSAQRPLRQPRPRIDARLPAPPRLALAARRKHPAGARVHQEVPPEARRRCEQPDLHPHRAQGRIPHGQAHVTAAWQGDATPPLDPQLPAPVPEQRPGRTGPASPSSASTAASVFSDPTGPNQGRKVACPQAARFRRRPDLLAEKLQTRSILTLHLVSFQGVRSPCRSNSLRSRRATPGLECARDPGRSMHK